MTDQVAHAYQLLGFDTPVPEDQVKQAYRDLVKVWHPDRFAHDPRLQEKAQEKLKELNGAYEIVLASLFENGPAAGSDAPPRPETAPPGEPTDATAAGRHRFAPWMAMAAVLLVCLTIAGGWQALRPRGQAATSPPENVKKNSLPIAADALVKPALSPGDAQFKPTNDTSPPESLTGNPRPSALDTPNKFSLSRGDISRPESTAGDSLPIAADALGKFTLSPDTAQFKLPNGIQIESFDDQSSLGSWDDANDTVTWVVQFRAPGKFHLRTAAAALDGGDFVVQIGDQQLICHAPKTGGWSEFADVDLGTVEIKTAGKTEMQVRAKNAATWKPVNLRAIIVTPEY